MPRESRVLTVFVASPGDVSEERTILEEEINRINNTWSRSLGIQFELVRWETHAYPEIGDDPQSVINDQIGDDYDIFIGIMWCRFGTPTGRAESGTVEEFNRAKQRFDTDPSSVSVMIYFKDAPLPPSKIDLTQLMQVQAFRNSLGSEGVLYWVFSTTDQFRDLVNLHLSRQAQNWKSRVEQMQDAETSNVPSESGGEALQSDASVVADSDELGFLDYLDITEKRFADLNEITTRIAEATEKLGEETTSQSNELMQLPRDSQGNVNRDAAKRIIRNTANEMDNYSARLEAELPLFSENMRSGIEGLTRLISLSGDYHSNEEYLDQIEELLISMAELRANFANASGNLSEFRGTISHLPRIISELNKAKRRLSKLLDQIIGDLSNAEKLLLEGENSIRDFLDRH